MFDLNLLPSRGVEFWRCDTYFVAFRCGCSGHADESGCYVTVACSPEHNAVAYAARQQVCEPASKTA